MANVVEFLLARITEEEEFSKPMVGLDDDDRGGWAIAYGEQMMAECAAKRNILAQCSSILDVGSREYDDAPELALGVLRSLAAVYADHEDYQQEWAA